MIDNCHDKRTGISKKISPDAQVIPHLILTGSDIIAYCVPLRENDWETWSRVPCSNGLLFLVLWSSHNFWSTGIEDVFCRLRKSSLHDEARGWSKLFHSLIPGPQQQAHLYFRRLSVVSEKQRESPLVTRAQKALEFTQKAPNLYLFPPIFRPANHTHDYICQSQAMSHPTPTPTVNRLGLRNSLLAEWSSRLMWGACYLREVSITVRSRGFTKPRDLFNKCQLLLNSAGISAALLPRCQPNLKAIYKFKRRSRVFEVSWDLMIRCIIVYWDGWLAADSCTCRISWHESDSQCLFDVNITCFPIPHMA